jgi:hypothetical protein
VHLAAVQFVMKRHKRSSRTTREHIRRQDGASAFFPDPQQSAGPVKDDLAENLAETFLQSATSGEEQGEDAMNELVAEEIGGPFVEESSTDLISQAELELELELHKPRRRRARPSPR